MALAPGKHHQRGGSCMNCTQVEDLDRQKREEMLRTGIYPFDWVEIVDTWGANERSKGGFSLHWGVTGWGSGEITFYTDLNGKLVCESESMQPGFVEQALAYLARSASMS